MVGEKSRLPYNYAHCDELLRQAITQMVKQRTNEMGNTALAEPARKLLESMTNHWAGLTVFVDHPEVPMDNNQAERALRTPVVGSKNFYGSGSQWSGQFAATMFSLLMTITLWSINSRTWLSAYLHACAANGNCPPSDLSPFLPSRMDHQQLAAMRSILVHPDQPASTHDDTS